MEYKSARVSDAVRDEMERRVDLVEYYHGFLPREDAEGLLVKDGDFVVRETSIDGHVEIVISVRYTPPGMDPWYISEDQNYKHFRVEVNYAGKFCLEAAETFRVVDGLIEFYWDTGRELPGFSGVQLLRPIIRQSWEFWDDEIQLVEEIESGAFGQIYSGLLSSNRETEKLVAVKLCNAMQHDCKLEFLAEARIMRNIGSHPNICQLIGIAVLTSPLKMILELADQDNLLNFLRNHTTKNGTSTISSLQKIHFACDAARGMRYLELQPVVHLDLRARSCLLKTDDANAGSKWTLMISSFRMSRIGTTRMVEKEEILAPRWAAPELLKNREGTVESDVWSFGVLLWEMFSDGGVPYPGVDDDGVEKYLEDNRMDPPPGCPPRIGQMMMECWDDEPRHRPTFKQLKDGMKSCYSHARFHH